MNGKRRRSRREGSNCRPDQKYFISSVQRVFSGCRNQENERIQLEADSTIRAGGYLGRRERVAVTSQAPVVIQIAGQFAPDLRGNQSTDTQLSNLSPARRRHVPQALSIVRQRSHTSRWGGDFPRSNGGGIGVGEGRAASAGSIESKMLPRKDGK